MNDSNSPHNTPFRVFSVEEIAEILQVSTRTVYRYINEGKLPATKIARRWYITDEMLKEALKGIPNE